MKKTASLLLIIIFGFYFSHAQKPVSKTSEIKKEKTENITGQILDDDSSPLEDVEIQISPVGAKTYRSVIKTTSDRKGKFVFKNIKPAQYKISLKLAGFVQYSIESNSNTQEQQNTFRIGDSAKLYMRKGGAITGKVTDEENNPLIQIPVEVVRVRDEFGQRIPAQKVFQMQRQNFTDDRGIYRIFGLDAGSYLVYVGRTGDDDFYKVNLTSTNNVPIYHLSDSIDTAAEVRVDFGQATEFIDIKFREKQGFSISGTILGADLQNVEESVSVSLIQPGSQQEIAILYVPKKDERHQFKIEAVPDGEFFVQAKSRINGVEIKKTPLQKVSVRGRDLSNLTLNLKPLASISGKLVYSENAKLYENPDCRKPEENSLFETIIEAVDLSTENRLTPDKESLLSGNSVNADENLNFEIIGLESGNYRLKINLSDESLYTDSIIQEISKSQIKNTGNNGIDLKTSVKANNIKIIVQNGAAKISGKVISDQNISNLSNYVVYLIPVDTDQKDEILRYRQTLTNDSNFLFTSVRPGNYYLLAEKLSENSNDISSNHSSKFWNIDEKQKLLEKAKNQSKQIEVKPCQTIQKINISF